jgi:hypothetical protein
MEDLRVTSESFFVSNRAASRPTATPDDANRVQHVEHSSVDINLELELDVAGAEIS